MKIYMKRKAGVKERDGAVWWDGRRVMAFDFEASKNQTSQMASARTGTLMKRIYSKAQLALCSSVYVRFYNPKDLSDEAL